MYSSVTIGSTEFRAAAKAGKDSAYFPSAPAHNKVMEASLALMIRRAPYCALKERHESSAVLSFRCRSPIRSIGKYALYKCELQFIDFAQLPLLESIGEFAFADCVDLSSVDFSSLLALRTVGEHAFWKCKCLFSVSFVNLPLLDTIGDGVFARCARLSSVDFSSLPSFRTIGAYAFQRCVSLQSISFARLPLFESIGERAFAGCEPLQTSLVSHPSELSKHMLSAVASLFSRSVLPACHYSRALAKVLLMGVCSSVVSTSLDCGQSANTAQLIKLHFLDLCVVAGLKNWTESEGSSS